MATMKSGVRSAARLTPRERSKMSASNFALPATRGYPIEDKKHAALAKSGASHAENIGNISRSTEQKIDRKADRVLSRGGRFLCLEFSQVDLAALDRLYRAYSFRAIPALGRIVTGDADAYRYLVESIRRFPSAETFRQSIETAGFARASFTKLSGGIVAIHSGWKL